MTTLRKKIHRVGVGMHVVHGGVSRDRVCRCGNRVRQSGGNFEGALIRATRIRAGLTYNIEFSNPRVAAKASELPSSLDAAERDVERR